MVENEGATSAEWTLVKKSPDFRVKSAEELK